MPKVGSEADNKEIIWVEIYRLTFPGGGKGYS